MPASAALLPINATQVSKSSGNVAAATASATMPATAGQTNFCTGFEITGAGATAASVVIATLVNTLGGTLSYTIAVPAGATVGITPLVVSFNPPLQCTAPNTILYITVPSLGAGNTNAAAVIHGYVE